MNSLTVRRAIINLGNIELDVFQLPNGEYILSETGCEKAVNKGERSIRDFLRGKSPQALPHKGFKSGKLSVENEPMRINGVPFEIAAAFWLKEAMSGNLDAVALLGAFAVEGLERRADKAFAVEKTEEQRNIDFANYLEKWRGSRQYARAAHGAFVKTYEGLKHPGWAIHDLMTTMIFGDTAAEARKKDLVDPEEKDESIGLNHQEDMYKMMVLADAKLKYAWIHNRDNETWQERTIRAVEAVIK